MRGGAGACRAAVPNDFPDVVGVGVGRWLLVTAECQVRSADIFTAVADVHGSVPLIGQRGQDASLAV